MVLLAWARGLFLETHISILYAFPFDVVVNMCNAHCVTHSVCEPKNELIEERMFRAQAFCSKTATGGGGRGFVDSWVF